jgi:hypothetical protein
LKLIDKFLQLKHFKGTMTSSDSSAEYCRQVVKTFVDYRNQHDEDKETEKVKGD